MTGSAHSSAAIADGESVAVRLDEGDAEDMTEEGVGDGVGDGVDGSCVDACDADAGVLSLTDDPAGNDVATADGELESAGDDGTSGVDGPAVTSGFGLTLGCGSIDPSRAVNNEVSSGAGTSLSPVEGDIEGGDADGDAEMLGVGVALAVGGSLVSGDGSPSIPRDPAVDADGVAIGDDSGGASHSGGRAMTDPSSIDASARGVASGASKGGEASAVGVPARLVTQASATATMPRLLVRPTLTS